MLFLTRLFGGTGDLERQFEFVLEGWINASKFQGLEHDKDPIAGDHDGTCNMTIRHKPIKKTLHGLPGSRPSKEGPTSCCRGCGRFARSAMPDRRASYASGSAGPEACT